MPKGPPILVDERFGKLVTIFQNKGRGYNDWLYFCDCGSEKLVSSRMLKSGDAKSCGCMKYSPEAIRAWVTSVNEGRFAKRTPILGLRFGRLLVTEDNKTSTINCVCDCGNTISPIRGMVIRGDIQSCGCYKREASSTRAKDRHRKRRIALGLPAEVDAGLRYSNEYRRAIRAVRERDKHTCVLCRKVMKGLHVHHLQKWISNPDLRIDHRNMVSLCKECHMVKAHANRTLDEPVSFIAEILKQYILDIYVGGEVEKNANLELTDEERLLILSGIRPERIARNWGDLSLEELVEIVNKPRNTKGDN